MVYPNPTIGQLIINNYELGIMNVEIFDILGKQLASLTSFMSFTSLNIAYLPNGIYFIRIQTENDVITQKFVKQ